MKTVVRYALRMLLPVIAVIVLYYCCSAYLDRQIEALYSQHTATVGHITGLAQKDKGNVLLKKSLENSSMLVMGSSELTSNVPENIRKLFPNNLYDYDISCVGHANVQNALHAINLGANFENINDNDFIIIESLQWFPGSDISQSGFFANFSELQFYEFLKNERISDRNKLYLCERYTELSYGLNLYPSISKFCQGNPILERINAAVFSTLEKTGYRLSYSDAEFPQTCLYARLYSSDHLGGKILYFAMQPYYWLQYRFLLLKDKYDAYVWLKGLEPEASVETVQLDWQEIYKTAQREGEEACTNNDIYVLDDYYDTYLRERYDSLKGRDADVELLVSREWDDYAFFLSVCNELDLHPYIVMMSVNGYYYDYIGLDQTKRSAYYERLRKTAEQYGIDCLDLQDCEYEPYFYCDVMHLGWKGWPYVVQNVIEYFSEE